MSRLIADQNEYKEGYKKHYRTYKMLNDKNTASRSRRLLLTYCNECGLKYLLLKKWSIIYYQDIVPIMENRDDPKNEIITTHNIEKIIKELGNAGEFEFPTKLKSARNIPIDSENYHQSCRYGIKMDNKMKNEEEKFENTMREIAEWIKNRIEEEDLL